MMMVVFVTEFVARVFVEIDGSYQASRPKLFEGPVECYSVRSFWEKGKELWKRMGTRAGFKRAKEHQPTRRATKALFA